MKINQDEIEAGAKAYCANRFEHGDKAIVWNDAIEAALRAALRVRKERKKAKRESKEEKDAPVTYMGAPIEEASLSQLREIMTYEAFIPMIVKSKVMALIAEKERESLTPKPLTIQAGKSYRTRDGQRVDIAVNDGSDKYCLGGKFYNSGFYGWWTIDGCYSFGRTHESVLISEWQE